MLTSRSTFTTSPHRLVLALLLHLAFPWPASTFSPFSTLSNPYSRASPIFHLQRATNQVLSCVIMPASKVAYDSDQSRSSSSLAMSIDSVVSAAGPTSAIVDAERTPHLKPPDQEDLEELVPSTMGEAFETFFVGSYNGPRAVVVALLTLVGWRLQLNPLEWSDAGIFSALVVVWWFQEHVLHKYALHSSFDWYGTSIHKEHHARPYAHVSIDPAPLMLGWLGCAALLLKLVLPLHLAISATLGYALAGLFYEWAHYIAHTKVNFPRNSYWYQMKHHQYVPRHAREGPGCVDSHAAF